MKLSLSLLATAAIALSALPAHAQSVAKAGQQCDPDSTSVHELECINPDPGPAAGLVLYVEEFQTCKKDGNVDTSDFDREVSAEVPSGTVIDNDTIKLTLDKVRTHIDFIPGANMSLIMPTKGVIQDGSTTYTMTITKKTQLDYQDAPAEEANFKGSFVGTNSSGKQISSGTLSCLFIM